MGDKELKSPFIEFDYRDDKRYSSRIKEGILSMIRIQKVFDQLGYLDLTPEVVSFVCEPNIRSKLETIVGDKQSRFSLSSYDLPLLMRAELVSAYFQHKISQHLGQLDAIEIFFSEGVRKILSKPIGTEVIERLGRKKVDSNLEKQIREELAQGVTQIYDTVFDKGADELLAGFAAPITQESRTKMQNALVPKTSSELTQLHLGGREAINSTLLFHALFCSQPASDKEKAIYWDGMRKIFQEDGNLPQRRQYNGLKLSRERYLSIPPMFRRIVHHYLMENFMDAQKIIEAVNIFRGGISKELSARCIIGEFLEAGYTGVTSKTTADGEVYIFDNDPSKDLEKIAMGAQYIIQALSSIAGKSLVPLKSQPASDKRRTKYNVGFFGMMSEFVQEQQYWEGGVEEMKASNAFEYFGITSQKKQEEFFNAYHRLFGKEGYEGSTGEEPWVKSRMKLMPDGRIQMAVVDDMYGKKDKIKWFNPFEFAKSSERGVDYFRRSDFDPNIDRLKEMVDKEVVDNNKVKHAIEIEVGIKCPIKVDEGLYTQILLIPDTLDQLAELDERIVALLPFVEQDYTAYMKMLGLDELKSEDQIQNAYRKALIRDKAHPDQTNNPQEKIEKGERMNQLIQARDELVHKLNLRVGGNSVSTYIGNISKMFVE